MAETRLKRNARILVVDDDIFITNSYREAFEREGFNVDVCFDGTEVMEKIQENQPDLIVLDLALPQMNGYKVLEELKEDEELKKIPVLVLSNLGDPSVVKKARALGAEDYLIKATVTISDVVKRVIELLEHKVDNE